MLPIGTPRLSLRRLRLEDGPRLANLVGNWNVVRWLSAVPFPYTLADAECFIIDSRAIPPDSRCVRAAVTRDGQFLGLAGLDPKPRGVELGYWLGEPFWGNGYMTEAASALVAAAFARPDIPVLTSGYLEGNAASAGVLAKLGFALRAVSRADVRRKADAIEPKGGK